MLKMKILLLVVISLANALDTITVSPLNKTSCSKGLIKDTDRLIFVGEIHLDKPDDRPTIQFDIKRKGDDGSMFITRCLMHIEICTPDDSKCYCYKTNQSNIIRYVFNITADVKDSNGTFKAYFSGSTGKESNVTISVPEIIDPAITSFRDITINGEEVKNECNKHYQHGNLSVHAACKDHLQPCTFELLVNGERKKQGPEIVFESKYNITSEVKLTIKQNICNNDQLSFNLNCIIKLNPDHGANESQDSKDIIKAVWVLAIIVPLLITIIITPICCCKAKKRRDKKKQIRTQLNQVKESQKKLKNDVENLKKNLPLDQSDEKDPLLHQRNDSNSPYKIAEEACKRLQTEIESIQQKLNNEEEKNQRNYLFGLPCVKKDKDHNYPRILFHRLYFVKTDVSHFKPDLEESLFTQKAIEEDLSKLVRDLQSEEVHKF